MSTTFQMSPTNPGEDTGGPVEIATGPGWVALHFHDRGPVYVVHEDGTVTERMSMPASDNIAQLPLEELA